jgi:voltage-gated potassium channel
MIIMGDKTKPNDPANHIEWRPHPGMWRFSTMKLLVALVLLILMTPLFEEFAIGDLIEALMITVVLVAAIIAIGGTRSVFMAAVLLLGPALIEKWLSYLYPQSFHSCVFFGFGIAFMGLVVFKLLGYVLRSAQIDTDVLCAAISVYLLLGLIWALAYALLGQLAPDSFAFAANPHSSGRMDRFTAFYFSFVTLSTVGFGDVTPLSKLARTVAVMEAVTGTFYVAILIARLVAMYAPASRAGSKDESRS